VSRASHCCQTARCHRCFAKLDPGLSGPFYYENPWVSGKCIGSRSAVGIIGSRLTAIDLALELRSLGHTGPIIMASRSGALPSVKGPVHDHTLKFVPAYVRDQMGHCREAHVSLRELASIVASEIDLRRTVYSNWSDATAMRRTTTSSLRTDIDFAESGKHVHWQSVLAALVPWIPELWRLLDLASQHELSTTYRTAWVTRVSSFPVVSARRLLPMMESGQLEVRSALRHISNGDGRYFMHFDDTDTVLEVDHVINATGPGYGRRALLAMPLTRCLLESGLADVHPNGGLTVAPDNFQVLTPNGKRLPGVYAIGDCSRSVWGATNTVVGVSRQAKILADHIISIVQGRRNIQPAASGF
jgi:uncharacterized NAD(P)/FAD-binding protein YdhS